MGGRASVELSEKVITAEKKKSMNGKIKIENCILIVGHNILRKEHFLFGVALEVLKKKRDNIFIFILFGIYASH